MDDLAKKLNITDSEGCIISLDQPSKNMVEWTADRKIQRFCLSTVEEVYPQYQESCRNFVLRIVRDLKLDKVEMFSKVSEEFPYYIHYLVYTKLHQILQPATI